MSSSKNDKEVKSNKTSVNWIQKIKKYIILQNKIKNCKKFERKQSSWLKCKSSDLNIKQKSPKWINVFPQRLFTYLNGISIKFLSSFRNKLKLPSMQNFCHYRKSTKTIKRRFDLILRLKNLQNLISSSFIEQKMYL